MYITHLFLNSPPPPPFSIHSPILTNRYSYLTHHQIQLNSYLLVFVAMDKLEELVHDRHTSIFFLMESTITLMVLIHLMPQKQIMLDSHVHDNVSTKLQIFVLC